MSHSPAPSISPTESLDGLPPLPRSRSPSSREEGDFLRLVYCSKLVVPDGKSGLEMISAISKLATAFNKTVGITGGLYYNSDTDMVVQVLEGLHCEVDMLLGNIRADSRHVNFRVIERSAQNQREFEEWGMKECTSEEWQHLFEKFPWVDELGLVRIVVVLVAAPDAGSGGRGGEGSGGSGGSGGSDAAGGKTDDGDGDRTTTRREGRSGGDGGDGGDGGKTSEVEGGKDVDGKTGCADEDDGKTTETGDSRDSSRGDSFIQEQRFVDNSLVIRGVVATLKGAAKKGRVTGIEHRVDAETFIQVRMGWCEWGGEGLLHYCVCVPMYGLYPE